MFSTFEELSVEEVWECATKHCCLDPVPTWLVKSCKVELETFLCHIVNVSLAKGIFPTNCKHAIVKPILKQKNLDINNMKNFRPVSNLSFVSKIIERAVLNQITPHIDNLLDSKQSAYRQGFSTESALLKLQNDILSALDQKKNVLLVLLDLSAAFDTVDHETLFSKLETDFYFCGIALDWFKSYLQNRSQSIQISHTTSGQHPTLYGVPQGSILGPVLVSLYTSSSWSLD